MFLLCIESCPIIVEYVQNNRLTKLQNFQSINTTFLDNLKTSMGKFGILSFTYYIWHQLFIYFSFVTSSIANLSTGSQKKNIAFSCTVFRPQIPSTVLNFVGLKSYTVQIRAIHCTQIFFHDVPQCDMKYQENVRHFCFVKSFLSNRHSAPTYSELVPRPAGSAETYTHHCVESQNRKYLPTCEVPSGL